MNVNFRLRTLVTGLSGILLLGSARAKPAAHLREPLPVEVAIDARTHNGRSPIALSPDGQWVCHTVEASENVPRATHQYSATGFPFAEGDSRMEATITSLKTGESIRLGGPGSSSWAAVWSPDGSRLAFYSDEGGEPGVWIWNMAMKRAERFPDVLARPFFGFETVRWSADGQKLLVKIVPAGMSLKEITDLGMSLEEGLKFPKVEPGQPSVLVKKSEAADKKGTSKPSPETQATAEGPIEWGISDLAILDLTSKSVTRLAERRAFRWYEFSPDGTKVGYTALKGWEANSQQPNFDIVIADLPTGKPARVLATNARLGYGFEFIWTPDSRAIAYIASGQVTKGPIIVLPADGSASRTLKAEGVPSFDPGEGEQAPMSDAKGRFFYAVGDGELWRVDSRTGAGKAIGKIPGWRIRAVVERYGRPDILAADGRTVYVAAREASNASGTKGPTSYWNDSGRAGFFSIDLESGASKLLYAADRAISTHFNLDANPKTGEIIFSATDQQHLNDLWVLDAKSGTVRQITHLNPEMERYELGQAKLIEWRSVTGESLKGALLLPPGYKAGTKLPLVVFVYGGDYGSRMVNRFGFWSLAALNCHILATRGFAVLSPDAPLREGMAMEDLIGTVMPGVNAAIDQGYADPNRLAVMGQSYGSYCVLGLITQTDRFKAAIITAAVLHPDLFADYLGVHGVTGIGYYEQGQGNMKGTIWEQRDRYFRNSPIFLFDRIQTPLMIGQGATDGRLVPSDAIFAALQRLGKPAEYLIYQGEGHVITQRANVLDFWKRRLRFLSENLDLVLDARGGVMFEGGQAKSGKTPPAAAGASSR